VTIRKFHELCIEKLPNIYGYREKRHQAKDEISFRRLGIGKIPGQAVGTGRFLPEREAGRQLIFTALIFKSKKASIYIGLHIPDGRLSGTELPDLA
jgi:hypothetical protein